MGSQDSLLEITYRSTVPAVICDPTTPKPEVSAVNLSALVASDPTSNVFSSSNGTLGSPLGRDQCLLTLECFRFLQGPPPPRLPSPPPLRKSSLPEGKCEAPPGEQLMSARFRESGIASEYESNTDTSDDNEDEGDEEEEEEEGEMEIFGWGTDEETLRLLNALNKQGSPDCLGDEIVVWHQTCFPELQQLGSVSVLSHQPALVELPCRDFTSARHAQVYLLGSHRCGCCIIIHKSKERLDASGRKSWTEWSRAGSVSSFTMEQHVVLMFNRNSIFVLSYGFTPKCKSNKDQGDQLKASPRWHDQ